jgi:putative ABC transport system substrate-binding protein
MRRRDFVSTIIASILCWPFVARAQEKLPKVGVLATASAASMGPWIAAFLDRLKSLGWEDGRNVAIVLRWADGESKRIQEIAEEFAHLKVDIVVTSGTSVPAAKAANPTTPIVFAIANDPVGAGLVTNLARPGGYITGLSQLAADLGGKRIEILREIVPSAKRLAILGDAGNQAAAPEMLQVQSAAESLGMTAELLDVRKAESIRPAIESLQGRVDALYVQSGPLMNTYRLEISSLALKAHLPTMSGIRDYVAEGGLISYGPDFNELFRRAAGYTDKILRGTKPGDLPIEQPTKFELAVNLTTGKALGLQIPDSFVLRADEVIE